MNKMKKIQKMFFALGTANSILVNHEEEQEEKVLSVLEIIKKRILQLDDELSVFKENSEISQIRKLAGKSLVEVSPDTYHIIKKSIGYAVCSKETFDITSHPLSELWGIGKKGDYIPSTKDIQRAKKLVNYQDILLQENPYRIGMRKKGQAIDLGGIAKGFAADWARDILIQYQITEAIINFGGTVIVLGQEKTIGIQNPESDTGKAIGSLTVKNQAVVTSGVYERFFLKDGIRYHHILDLQTGKPSDTGIVGITVIGESAMEMDALATSVILLGIEAGMELIRKFHAEGIFITDTKEVYITPGLTDKFQMINLQENSYGK